MTADNKMIGMFKLEGITPAPRGVPQIEVSFNIDVNGIVTVKAVDKATNKEQQITISNNGGISAEDIERMKAEAEQYKEEDKKKAEDAAFINQAEMVALSIEKTLDSEDFKDKISDEDKEAVKPLVDKVKEAVNTRIKDDVDSAMKELDKVWTPIAQKLYPPQENPGQQFNFDPSQFGGSSGPGNPFTSNN
jgi:molecular chaperone DnaK